MRPLLSGETPLMTRRRQGPHRRGPRAARAWGRRERERIQGRSNSPDVGSRQQASRQIVKLLVEHGADVRARSNGNFTPLLFAAQQGDVESGRALLQAGADVNEQQEQGPHDAH